MKLILAILALAAFCQVEVSCTNAQRGPSTLFGGRIVPSEYSHAQNMISFEMEKKCSFHIADFQPISLMNRNGRHICGGSIYNENYVITAAHCVQGASKNTMRIVAGTINLQKPQSIYTISRIIIHSKYNPRNSWINDIALVKVATPFVMSKTISNVSLPEKGHHPPVGTIAVTSGWGSLWEGGASPTELQRTNVLIASQDYCNRTNSAEGLPVHDTQICIFDPNVKTGPCHGDSGGPLTIDGKLMGITSWGIRCASLKYPGVFTRVSEYVDWINTHAI